MERADSTARILDVKYHILLPSVKDVGGAVDYYQWSAVLRSVAAFEAYRKVYRDVITPLKLAGAADPARRHPEEPALLPAPGARHARATCRTRSRARRCAARARSWPSCSTGASRRSSPAACTSTSPNSSTRCSELSSSIQRSFFVVDARSSRINCHDLLRRAAPRHRDDLRLRLAHQRGRGPHRHVHRRCASTRRRTTA